MMEAIFSNMQGSSSRLGRGNNMGNNMLESMMMAAMMGTHSPTHSLTYSLTHSLTHSLTYSLTYLLLHVGADDFDSDDEDILYGAKSSKNKKSTGNKNKTRK